MKIYYLIIFSISLYLTKYKVLDVSSSSHFQNVPYKQGKEREVRDGSGWKVKGECRKKKKRDKEGKEEINIKKTCFYSPKDEMTTMHDGIMC